MKKGRKTGTGRKYRMRSAFCRALFLELVRTAVLESFRICPCRSEDEALLFCFWKLLNPFGLESRVSAEAAYAVPDSPEDKESTLPPRPVRTRTVTVHAHSDEPLVPSPDDMLLYDRIDLERGACSHFIADGFRLKKVR